LNPVAGQHVGLLKGAGVQEHVDALPGTLLAPRVLPVERILAPRDESFRTALSDFLDPALDGNQMRARVLGIGGI